MMLIEVLLFLTVLCLIVIPIAVYFVANFSIWWVIALCFIALFALECHEPKKKKT